MTHRLRSRVNPLLGCYDSWNKRFHNRASFITLRLAKRSFTNYKWLDIASKILGCNSWNQYYSSRFHRCRVRRDCCHKKLWNSCLTFILYYRNKLNIHEHTESSFMKVFIWNLVVFKLKSFSLSIKCYKLYNIIAYNTDKAGNQFSNCQISPLNSETSRLAKHRIRTEHV